MRDIGTSMTHIAEMLEDIARRARAAGEGQMRLWIICPFAAYPEGETVPAIVVRAESAEAARAMATQSMSDGDDAQGWGVHELTAAGPAGVVVHRGMYWW